MTDIKTPKNTDSRSLAVRALGRILSDEEQLEVSLSSDSVFNRLEPRDRAFARLLVATTLRRLGQIDSVLNKYVKQTPPSYVQNALRIGAAQLLFIGTASHAAVGETVALVKSHKSYVKFSGLANAVLRKISREGKAKLAQTAPRDNIPVWIYRSWENNFDRSAARQMALEYVKIPPLDISVRSDPQKWAETLGGEVIFGNTVRLTKAGQITELPGYKSGDWWVQDVSATLPVIAIADNLDDLDGKTVLDMCAAPGGKTLQLASKGAVVTALDKSAKRLDILRSNLERTNLSAQVVQGDALTWDEDGENFDIVLLDAPCSATGTFRRHPDVLHNKSQKQMGQLIKLQRELLLSAVKKLRPGGLLMYCTCSLQVEEGEEQIDWFLQKQSDFEVIRFSDEKWREFGNSGGHLRLLPHQIREKGGLDGFFLSLLRQKT